MVGAVVARWWRNVHEDHHHAMIEGALEAARAEVARLESCIEDREEELRSVREVHALMINLEQS